MIKDEYTIDDERYEDMIERAKEDGVKIRYDN